MPSESISGDNASRRSPPRIEQRPLLASSGSLNRPRLGNTVPSRSSCRLSWRISDGIPAVSNDELPTPCSSLAKPCVKRLVRLSLTGCAQSYQVHPSRSSALRKVPPHFSKREHKSSLGNPTARIRSC